MLSANFTDTDTRNTTKAGKNIKVDEKTQADGTIEYTVSTKDEVEFDKVTVGPVFVDKTDGINAGDTQIKGVKAGVAPTDAVNVSQLKTVTEEVTAGNGVAVKTTPATADKGASFEVSVKTDGVTTEINDAGQVAAKTSDLTVNNGVVATPAAPKALATAGDVANAVNNAGWVLQEKGTQKDLVTAGNVVNFVDGAGTRVSVNTANDISEVKYDVKVNEDKGVVIGPDGLEVKVDNETIKVNDKGQLYAPQSPQSPRRPSVTPEQLAGVRDDLRAGIAGSAAMGMIAQPNESGEAIIGAGVGYHRGEAALAVGMTATSDNNNWIIKGAVGVDTQKQATAGFSVNYKIW